MRNWRKLFSAFALIAMVTVGFSANAASVSSSDVAVEITAPEDGEEVGVGDLLTGGFGYEYDLENTLADNDTTVDTYVKLTDEDGDVVDTYNNDTNVDSGETVTESGELSVSDLTYNEDGEDVTLNVESTFTDSGDSSTATVTDSVDASIYKSGIFGMIMSLLIVVALLGAFTRD